MHPTDERLRVTGPGDDKVQIRVLHRHDGERLNQRHEVLHPEVATHGNQDRTGPETVILPETVTVYPGGIEATEVDAMVDNRDALGRHAVVFDQDVAHRRGRRDDPVGESPGREAVGGVQRPAVVKGNLGGVVGGEDGDGDASRTRGGQPDEGRVEQVGLHDVDASCPQRAGQARDCTRVGDSPVGLQGEGGHTEALHFILQPPWRVERSDRRLDALTVGVLGEEGQMIGRLGRRDEMQDADRPVPRARLHRGMWRDSTSRWDSTPEQSLTEQILQPLSCPAVSRPDLNASVVVPTFRRPGVLLLTLEALRAQTYPADRYEVIVVDDGSGDDTRSTVETVASQWPGLRYVTQENAGAATARNHGARLAGGRLLIFVDDDIIVPVDMIEQHLAAHARFREKTLVAGMWDFTTEARERLEATSFGRFRLGLQDEFNVRVDGSEPVSTTGEGLAAGNLSLFKEGFLELGGFDGSIPHAGAEDHELAMRAARDGYTLLVHPGIELGHNDEHIDLLRFCRREERGAVTLVHLAALHPDDAAARQAVRDPRVRRHDSAGTAVRKLVRNALSAPAALSVVFHVVRALDRVLPRGVPHRLYQVVIGLHRWRGYRAGHRQVAERGRRSSTMTKPHEAC